jgi:hypothetical protein
MEFVNYAILVGPQFATKEEKLIVALSIMQLLKFLKETNMINRSIYGVLEF